MDKTYASAADAVADIPDGASLAVGGFGLSGVPIVLIRALLARGTSKLEIVSNNCGVDGWGLGELLSAGRIRKVIASYIGENKGVDVQVGYVGDQFKEGKKTIRADFRVCFTVTRKAAFASVTGI